jgi:hypothetical protein
MFLSNENERLVQDWSDLFDDGGVLFVHGGSSGLVGLDTPQLHRKGAAVFFSAA